jgi:hypothetical protein
LFKEVQIKKRGSIMSKKTELFAAIFLIAASYAQCAPLKYPVPGKYIKSFEPLHDESHSLFFCKKANGTEIEFYKTLELYFNTKFYKNDAAKKKDNEITLDLIKKCCKSNDQMRDCASARTKAGYESIHFAAVFEDKELMRFLVEEDRLSMNRGGPGNNTTPLLMFVENGNKDLVKFTIFGVKGD